MAYVTIDCRKVERTFATQDHATEWAYRELFKMPTGTVAAVWSGDTQTHALAVRRILKAPRVFVRQKWPTMSEWRVIDPSLPLKERERVNKAANA